MNEIIDSLKKVYVKNKFNIRIAVVGVIVGVVNGLIGSFGGALAVIWLIKLNNLSQKQAQATTLSFLWLACIVSIILTSKEVNLDTIYTLIIVLASVVGSFLGTYILKKLKNSVLKMVFAILMIIMGVMILI